MPTHDLSFYALAQTIDDEFLLVEPLLCPETSQLGRDAARVRKAVESRVRKLVEELDPGVVQRRLIPERPRVGSIEISVVPKSRSIGWREPVRLTFYYVLWSHGEALVAYVPSLDIEVIVDQSKLLKDRLAAEIRLALLRNESTNSLRDLLWFERLGTLAVKPLNVTADIRTPKQIARAERDAADRKKSVLKEVAVNLTRQKLSPAFEVADIVGQLAETLAGVPPQSVLLIGPSGVGKTEMAKALSEFLYQDSDRIIRFDMSEYSDAMSIDRLIGGSVLSQGLLTRKVRQQPFAVVLLDEFEKAHPSFFDLLLQVLGEGRLTDAAGRVANFTNSVVIMTSNLGVESFREQALGFGDAVEGSGNYAEHFESRVRDFLRPEFFNRIDRIVPFSPLGRDTIQSIARREVEKVLSRDGVRFRNVTVDVDDAAVGRLARAGYEPQYGARALRRVIERELVTPLAEGLNGYSDSMPLHVQGELIAGRMKLTVRGVEDGQGEPGGEAAGAPSARKLASHVTNIRRRIQRADRSSVVLAMRNEITRLDHVISRTKRSRKRGRKLPEPRQAMQELTRLQKLVAQVDGLNDEACRLEDEVLLAIYRKQAVEEQPLVGKFSEWDERFQAMATDVIVSRQENANRATLVVFGEELGLVSRLGRTYERLLEDRDVQLQRYLLTPFRAEQNQQQAQGSSQSRLPGRTQAPSMTLKSRKTHSSDRQKKLVDAYFVRRDDAFWQALPEIAVGVALQASGDAVRLYLEDEEGIHQLKSKSREMSCLVETCPGLLIHYDPPRGITRQGAISKQSRRRTYDLDERTAFDEKLRCSLTWPGEAIHEVVAAAIEQTFRTQLELLFD